MGNRDFLPFWEYENAALDKNQINIILLAHVQEPRGHINPSQIQCNETERFSIDEFYEIYKGIVNAGYYIQSVYYNELDFISDYTEHPEKFANSLVYSLARNGLRENKKTIIPSFCELVGLKYSCSSSLSCALCRNKYYFTSLLRTHNIPAPKSWLLTQEGRWINEEPKDGTCVICKPCSESASQGVNEDCIFSAAKEKFHCFHETSFLVQEYIDGIECEVPVFKIGDTIEVLPPVGIDLMGNPILDERNSTDYHYGFYHLADTQSQDIITTIQDYARRAFQLMQMEVYGRIDFRLGSDGIPYIFDISTTPYTTMHSSFAFSFEYHGYMYSDIYQAVVTAALQRSLK